MLVLAPKVLNHSSETMVKTTVSTLPEACCLSNNATVKICPLALKPGDLSIMQATCCRTLAVFLERQPANDIKSHSMDWIPCLLRNHKQLNNKWQWCFCQQAYHNVQTRERIVPGWPCPELPAVLPSSSLAAVHQMPDC